ncbi:MAG: GlsB/YeaQ/YmgE family stress response membrane protein [Rhizobium sp.]
MQGVGWLAAIVIGGIAGWLAGKLMEMRFGIFMNIILGIVGSVVANAILAQFHIAVAGGWLGYLVTGFIGASILLFLVKLVRR